MQDFEEFQILSCIVLYSRIINMVERKYIKD